LLQGGGLFVNNQQRQTRNSSVPQERKPIGPKASIGNLRWIRLPWIMERGTKHHTQEQKPAFPRTNRTATLIVSLAPREEIHITLCNHALFEYGLSVVGPVRCFRHQFVKCLAVPDCLLFFLQSSTPNACARKRELSF